MLLDDLVPAGRHALGNHAQELTHPRALEIRELVERLDDRELVRGPGVVADNLGGHVLAMAGCQWVVGEDFHDAGRVRLCNVIKCGAGPE